MEPSVVGVPTSAAPPAPPARATPEIEERLVQLMASMEPLRRKDCDWHVWWVKFGLSIHQYLCGRWIVKYLIDLI